MSKKIIIDGSFPKQVRVVLLNNNNSIEDLEYEISNKQQIKGNIYLAKIIRVEPSLQAAFIDYGNDKSGFLPFNEINPDYFHIPVSDQKSSIANLKEIAQPEFTSEDLKQKDATSKEESPSKNNDEIDIKTIEQLIEDKAPIEFDLDASELDIEHFNNAGPNNFSKNYRIQEVIKKGQIILVQVVKEERGNKGASFTSFISLAGKYCVLMPNKPSQNGVSRKILNADERRRIKDLISQLNVENDRNTASVIARTAATGKTNLELKRDYDYLVRLWNKIREVTLKATAPSFIHEEEGIIQKTIRDMLDHNVKEMLVQGSTAYNSALKFLKDILPTETHRLREYKSTIPIFTKLEIEEQLATLYQPIVSLSSGGYIVINPTEALTSIDVNSGRATSERNIEETALKTNLEAAKEIARQIKLRNLSGLIVIDFIDMMESRNRKIIERSIKEFLSKDRARIQISSISNLGLLEISRQRMRPTFLEFNSTICSHCNGKGIIRADESNAMLILRTVENELANDKVDTVNVYASINSVIYLLNNKRSEISLIENKYKISLNFYFDHNATSDSYSVEKIRNNKKSNDAVIKPLLHDISDIYQDNNPVVEVTQISVNSNEQNNRNKRKWKNNPNQRKDLANKNEVIKDDKTEIVEKLSSIDQEPDNIPKTQDIIEPNKDEINKNLSVNEESTKSNQSRKRRNHRRPQKKIKKIETLNEEAKQ